MYFLIITTFFFYQSVPYSAFPLIKLKVYTNLGLYFEQTFLSYQLGLGQKGLSMMKMISYLEHLDLVKMEEWTWFNQKESYIKKKDSSACVI